MDEVMRLLIDEHCLIICESVEEKKDLLKIMYDNDFPMTDLCYQALSQQLLKNHDAFYAHEGRKLFVAMSKMAWRPTEVGRDIFYRDISFTTPLDHIDIPNLCKLFDEEVASE